MRETITPEMAREYMKLNVNNRRLSKHHWGKIASDMKEGLFVYNGDPIRFGADGSLIDGQHRLEACIRSGVPFETEVIRDLPEEVRPTIDNGRKRSAGDALNLLGGAARANTGIAASCRQVLNYVCGFLPTQSQSTPAIVRLLARYPDIADSYRLATKCNRILVPGPLGAVLFMGSRASGMEKRVLRFVEGVQSGIDLQAGDPRHAVREAFMNKRASGAGARLPELTWCFIATARAWNAWATGQPLNQVSVRKNMDGSWNIPDIIGGPPRGDGVDSLDAVQKAPLARRSQMEREEAAFAP